MANVKLTENAGETTLASLFSSQNFLQVPFFQRYYEWDKRFVERFQRDLLGVVDPDRPESIHFLGAILTAYRPKPHSGHPNLVEIIDGQQRLTTLFIHLCATVHALIDADEVNEARDLFQQRVVNSLYGDEMSNILLHSGGDDRSAVNEMVESLLRHKKFEQHVPQFKLRPLTEYGGGAESKSRVAQNFRLAKAFFKEQVELAGVERIREIREALLEKMTLVEIQVKSPVDGPKIYNSLNSAQKKMSTGDLVRNDVFSRIADSDVAELKRLDDEEWRPFYTAFDTNGKLEKNFDGYFFPYGLIHNSQLTTATVYEYLVRKWGDQTPHEVIEDLSTYQPAYLALSAGKPLDDAPAALNGAISELVDARTPSSTFSFLMRLIAWAQEGADEEVKCAIEVMNLIEAFLVRRGLSGKEPTGLHAVFKDLWDDIEGTPSTERIVAAIKDHSTVDRPNDAELRQAIAVRNAYKMKITPYVLREYDRSFGGDDVGLPSEIEHILPQSPSAGWDAFKKEDREELTNTLANLLPLTKKMNGDVSNAAFEKKRPAYAKDSGFKSVREFAADYETWTPADVALRSSVIQQWAVERWPDPFVAR